MQKETELTQCMGIAAQLKMTVSWCVSVGQLNLNIMLRRTRA